MVVFAIIFFEIYNNIKLPIIIRAGIININHACSPDTGTGTFVGEVFANIISVGVAVGAPGAVQQELYDGLALQALAKSGLVQ